MQDDRVDAYYRLSMMDGDVAEQNGKTESYSISSQRSLIKEYIRSEFGEACEIVEHIDDGYTGTNFDRPGFQNLIQEVYKGNVHTIIAKDFSRLGRNWLEVGHFLEKVFPAYRVRVILINEGYDSAKVGDATLEMGSVIKNLINEWYSRDISKKIKSVVDIKKMSGEFVYGWAPFGYRKGEAKNTIVVDEPAARTVRLIFSMANQGKTIPQIARELNEKKVVTPSVYLADVRRNYKIREFWTYESVRNIITNRIYTGDTEAFKSHVVQVGSDKVKSIPWDERPVIENTHIPIITREEYFGARKVIKSVSKSSKEKESDMLSGYLVCGCCGNKLSNSKASNKNYYCASARYNPQSDCSKVKISKIVVGDVLLHSIQTQIQMADLKLKEMEKVSKSGNSEKRKMEKELRQLGIRLENSRELSMSLYEDYIEGRLSRTEFQKKKEDAAKKHILWEKRRDELQQQLERYASKEAGQAIQQKYVKKYLDITELNRNILKEFVKAIVIMPDLSIQIQWNFRLDEVV